MKQKSKNSMPFRTRDGKISNRPDKNVEKTASPKRGIKAGTKAGRILAEQRETRGEDLRAKKRGHATQNDSQNDAKRRINIFGLHAVEAAIMNPTRGMHAIYCTDATENTVFEWVEKARIMGIKRPEPITLDKPVFDRTLPKDTVHQGVGLDAAPLSEVFLPDIINTAATREKAVIVVLDQVTDPHNMGAIMRSACAFGASAIIVQSRHAPELGGIVAKTACGAMEHVAVVYETNLARSIENLKEHGFFALALDERGTKTIGESPRYAKTVLVLGAEGSGLRPLIREKCDVLVKLPTSGALSSLNVSNAAAVALYAIMYSS